MADPVILADNNPPLFIDTDKYHRILTYCSSIFYKRLPNSSAKVSNKQSLANEKQFKIASSVEVTLKSPSRSLENFPAIYFNNDTPWIKEPYSCTVGLYSYHAHGLKREIIGETGKTEWRGMIQDGFVALHQISFPSIKNLTNWKKTILTEGKSNPKFVIVVNINNSFRLATNPFEFGQNSDLPPTQPTIQYRVPVTPSPMKLFTIENRDPNQSPVVNKGAALLLTVYWNELVVAPLELSWIPTLPGLDLDYPTITPILYRNKQPYVDVEVGKNTCSIRYNFKEGTNEITLFGQTEQFHVLSMSAPQSSPNSDDMDMDGSDSSSSGTFPHQDGADGPPGNSLDDFFVDDFLNSPDYSNNNNNNDSYNNSNNDSYQMSESDIHEPSNSNSETPYSPPEDLDSDLPPEETEPTITAVLPSSVPVGVPQLAAILGNFERIYQNPALEIAFGGQRAIITSRSPDRFLARMPMFTNPRYNDLTIRDAHTGVTLATKERALMVFPPQQVPKKAQKNKEVAQENRELVPKDEQPIQQTPIQALPAANVELEIQTSTQREESTKQTPQVDYAMERSFRAFGESRFVDVVKRDVEWEEICSPLNRSNWREFGEQLGFKDKQLDEIENRNKESPTRQMLEEWETKSGSTMKNYITALVNVNEQTTLNRLTELFPRYTADIVGIVESQRREKVAMELQLEKLQNENLKLQIQGLSQAKVQVESKLKEEKASLEQQLGTLQTQLTSANPQRNSQVPNRTNIFIPNLWIIMTCIVVVLGIGIAVFFAHNQLQTSVSLLQSQLDQATGEKQLLQSTVAQLALELQNRTQNLTQSSKTQDNNDPSPKTQTNNDYSSTQNNNDYYSQTKVTISLVNGYLHVTGNTYRIKEMLKQHGARWLPNEKAWKIPNSPGKAEELSQIIKTLYPTENVEIQK